MYSLKGLAAWAQAARAAGITDAEIDTFINGSVFATLTNGALRPRAAAGVLARMHVHERAAPTFSQINVNLFALTPHAPTHPHPLFQQQYAVNFDDARFVDILKTADALKARLAKALAAKGAPGPAAPTPAELGWGGVALPHPAQWSLPAGASARDLERLSRQVRACVLGGGLCMRMPRPCLQP